MGCSSADDHPCSVDAIRLFFKSPGQIRIPFSLPLHAQYYFLSPLMPFSPFSVHYYHCLWLPQEVPGPLLIHLLGSVGSQAQLGTAGGASRLLLPAWSPRCSLPAQEPVQGKGTSPLLPPAPLLLLSLARPGFMCSPAGVVQEWFWSHPQLHPPPNNGGQQRQCQWQVGVKGDQEGRGQEERGCAPERGRKDSYLTEGLKKPCCCSCATCPPRGGKEAWSSGTATLAAPIIDPIPLLQFLDPPMPKEFLLPAVICMKPLQGKHTLKILFK